MDDDVFSEEDEFFCGICGKQIDKNEEISEEICMKCLKSLLQKE